MGAKGQPCSEAHKQRLRELMTGKPKSKEASMKSGLARRGNKYRLGKKHTEESKQKNRESHLGKKVSEEAKQKMSAARLGKYTGENNSFYGKHHSEETREKISKALKGKKHSEEQIKGISAAAKQRWDVPGMRERIAKKVKLSWQNPERKKAIGETIRKYWQDPEHRKAQSELFKGRPVSQETREKLRVVHKAKFNDPLHIAKMAKAWNIKPNKPETQILQLLNSLYPDQWKYTGDFSFTINGKSPDFTNCNGQKKLIELFGDYWHRGENPQDRANVFSPFGYETLVIWEHELKDMSGVVTKIREFHEAA